MDVSFKDRYVLAEGYPWASDTDKHYEIGMCKKPIGLEFKALKWPKELWDNNLPKYRLVLERVED